MTNKQLVSLFYPKEFHCCEYGIKGSDKTIINTEVCDTQECLHLRKCDSFTRQMNVHSSTQRFMPQ